MTNTLGNVITILQEFSFTKQGDPIEPFFCKLYRTKEGTWYDIEDENKAADKGILMALKSEINMHEIPIKEQGLL